MQGAGFTFPSSASGDHRGEGKVLYRRYFFKKGWEYVEKTRENKGFSMVSEVFPLSEEMWAFSEREIKSTGPKQIWERFGTACSWLPEGAAKDEEIFDAVMDVFELISQGKREPQCCPMASNVWLSSNKVRKDGLSLKSIQFPPLEVCSLLFSKQKQTRSPP